MVSSWFETLGVKASEARLRGVLNLTCWIPYEILCRSLHELALEKADGFATAPQPGEILARARSIARRWGGDLEYSAQTGTFAEPEWAQQTRQLLVANVER